MAKAKTDPYVVQRIPRSVRETVRKRARAQGRLTQSYIVDLIRRGIEAEDAEAAR